MGEEGSHEGHEGYEGDEEEGSHEGHEGDEGEAEEGSHEGHKGHEGDEEEGSREGHEGHESYEEVKAIKAMKAARSGGRRTLLCRLQLLGRLRHSCKFSISHVIDTYSSDLYIIYR